MSTNGINYLCSSQCFLVTPDFMLFRNPPLINSLHVHTLHFCRTFWCVGKNSPVWKDGRSIVVFYGLSSHNTAGSPLKLSRRDSVPFPSLQYRPLLLACSISTMRKGRECISAELLAAVSAVCVSYKNECTLWFFYCRGSLRARLFWYCVVRYDVILQSLAMKALSAT